MNGVSEAAMETVAVILWIWIGPCPWMFSCGKRPFTGTFAVDMISDIDEPSKGTDGWRVEVERIWHLVFVYYRARFHDIRWGAGEIVVAPSRAKDVLVIH